MPTVRIARAPRRHLPCPLGKSRIFATKAPFLCREFMPLGGVGCACALIAVLCVSSAVLAYWCEVWTLCEALWGQRPHAEPLGHYERQMERRRAFSSWLSRRTARRVEEEVARAGKGRRAEAVFSYLTGNRISEACRLAQKEGERAFSH